MLNGTADKQLVSVVFVNLDEIVLIIFVSGVS